jgi:hypothetical protein
VTDPAVGALLGTYLGKVGRFLEVAGKGVITSYIPTALLRMHRRPSSHR